MVRGLSGGIFTQKDKKKFICWLLRISEDTLFYFQLVKLSTKTWLMVHVDYLMIVTILERCELWQSCNLTYPNEFKRTVIFGKLLFTKTE